MRYWLVLAAILLLCWTGCENETPPPNGFAVKTIETTVINGHSFTSTAGNIFVFGQWLADLGTPQGAVYAFTAHTSSIEGYYAIPDARIPATWDFSEENGPCAGQMIVPYIAVNPGDEVELICSVITGTGFTASPVSYDIAQTRDIKVSGQGIRSTYGLPNLAIVDAGGTTVYYQGPPDSHAPDMSSVTVSASTLQTAGLIKGNYGMVVQNALGDGTYKIVGVAPFSVTNRYPNCGKGGICPP